MEVTVVSATVASLIAYFIFSEGIRNFLGFLLGLTTRIVG